MDRFLLAAPKQQDNQFQVGGPGELGIPNVGLEGGLQGILSALFIVAGALAVVFVVVGGLRYVLSNGEPKDVEAAKNTIMYAVLGLIISLLASAIINWVLGSL